MTNPVRIRGVDYPSQAAAARALGVTRNTVNCALERGDIDSIGLWVVPKTPVTIRGVEYESASAAARALNLSPSTIFAAINRGTLDNAGLSKR